MTPVALPIADVIETNRILLSQLEGFDELIRLYKKMCLSDHTSELDLLVRRCNEIMLSSPIKSLPWNYGDSPTAIDYKVSADPLFFGLPRGAEYRLSRLYETTVTRAPYDLAYALPSPESVAAIEKLLKDASLTGGIIEVGPGKGLWGKLFQNLGIGYQGHFVKEEMDKYPEFHSALFLEEGIFFHDPYDLSYLDGDTPSRHALFLCWPPVEKEGLSIHGNDIAFRAAQTFLKAARKNGVEAHIIYIGERLNEACTAGPRFETLINMQCELVATYNIHRSQADTFDKCWIFKSKKAIDITSAITLINQFEGSVPKDRALLDVVSAYNTQLLGSGIKAMQAFRLMRNFPENFLDQMIDGRLRRKIELLLSKLNYCTKPTLPKLEPGKGCYK